MGVSDKSRTSQVGMEAFHDVAVAEVVSDLLVVDSPELLLSLKLNFTPADGLFLGYQLAVEVNIRGYTFVLEL